MVPFDPRTPFDPSGIRIGTPAITTRGMKEADMETLANWMNDICKNHEDESTQKRILGEIKAFCADFPIPGIN
jgi:glycine hydroxymethyltransferase